MSLPTSIDPSVPADSESPRLGAQRIREVKQLLIDLGLPQSPTTISVPIFNSTGGGSLSTVLNSSGAGSVLGDIVRIPQGAANAYALSDTVRSLEPYISVNGTVSSGSSGPTVPQGIASALYQGLVTSGNYIRKSATTKAVEDTGIAANATNPIPFGAIGVALTTGTTVVGTVYLFGMTRNPLVAAGDAVSGNWIAGPSGLLYSDATQTGTPANTSETTLSMNFTLPANALTGTAGRGRAVRAKAWGFTSANSNSKTMKLYFGSTFVANSGANVMNSVHWYLEFVVLHKTATSQEAVGYFYGPSSSNFSCFRSALTETESGTINIKCTGQNGTAAANDVLQTGGMIEILN